MLKQFPSHWDKNYLWVITNSVHCLSCKSFCNIVLQKVPKPKFCIVVKYDQDQLKQNNKLWNIFYFGKNGVGLNVINTQFSSMYFRFYFCYFNKMSVLCLCLSHLSLFVLNTFITLTVYLVYLFRRVASFLVVGMVLGMGANTIFCAILMFRIKKQA